MKALIALVATIVTMAVAGPALGDTFITDTLAPGGSMSPQHRWFLIEHSDQTAQPQGYRFITDTLAPGGGAASVSAPASDGFRWSDAGVGAGAAVGGMLALIGSALIVVRRQGRPAV
jgi:hypothetical protein